MYLDRFNLKGRVAVVTGGGQGIGLACVEALSEAGAHVYIADRNPKAAAEGQAAMKAKGYVRRGHRDGGDRIRSRSTRPPRG